MPGPFFDPPCKVPPAAALGRHPLLLVLLGWALISAAPPTARAAAHARLGVSWSPSLTELLAPLIAAVKNRHLRTVTGDLGSCPGLRMVESVERALK